MYIFSLLDFNSPPLHFNVQSATQLLHFWTSSVYFSTSTSNPSLLSVPFGLLLAFPLLQRPIRRAASSLLDFLRVFHYFNIQSAAQLLPFWTSSVYSTTSTSNPPRSFFPFGLLRAFPPLQRPIRHSFSSLLDFLRAFLYFNVQFATQLLPFWTSACLPTASTSNSNLSAPQFLPLQIF